MYSCRAIFTVQSVVVKETMDMPTVQCSIYPQFLGGGGGYFPTHHVTAERTWRIFSPKTSNISDNVVSDNITVSIHMKNSYRLAGCCPLKGFYIRTGNYRLPSWWDSVILSSGMIMR